MTLKTYNYDNLLEEQLSNIDTAKIYYREALKTLKEENKSDFLFYILDVMNKVLSKEDFKKITKFDYINFSKQEETKDVLKSIQLAILKTGKTNVIKKSGLTMPTINKLFNLQKQEEIKLKTFFSLINSLDLQLLIVPKNV